MILLPVSFSGCSSIAYRTKSKDLILPAAAPAPGLYPGVRGDVKSMARAFRDDYEAQDYSLAGPFLDAFEVLYFPIALFDTPLSFGLDTLYLPYDIFHSTSKDASQGLNEE